MGVKNLFVVGRVIGGDKVSYVVICNMMCCMVMG